MSDHLLCNHCGNEIYAHQFIGAKDIIKGVNEIECPKCNRKVFLWYSVQTTISFCVTDQEGLSRNTFPFEPVRFSL